MKHDRIRHEQQPQAKDAETQKQGKACMPMRKGIPLQDTEMRLVRKPKPERRKLSDKPSESQRSEEFHIQGQGHGKDGNEQQEDLGRFYEEEKRNRTRQKRRYCCLHSLQEATLADLGR